MQNELLKAKSQEIEQMLRTWASEKLLLENEQRLVCILRIENHSEVSQSDKIRQSFGKLSVEQFFTLERLMYAGAPKHIANRICRQLAYNTKPNSGRMNQSPMLMKEFTDLNGTEEKLLLFKNIGQVCIPFIMKAMEPLRR